MTCSSVPGKRSEWVNAFQNSLFTAPASWLGCGVLLFRSMFSIGGLSQMLQASCAVGWGLAIPSVMKTCFNSPPLSNGVKPLFPMT